jgi:hypothetical protein
MTFARNGERCNYHHPEEFLMTLRRCRSAVLTFLMFYPMGAAPLLAQARGGWSKYSPGQLQAALRTLGTGQDARVSGKRRDKTTISGYVSQVDPGHFVVMDARTSQTIPVSYEDVKELRGENSANGVQFAARVSRSLNLRADDVAGGQSPRQLCCDRNIGWVRLLIPAVFLAIIFIAVLSDRS